MANPNQYFRLAEHIKLLLLDRQRSVAAKTDLSSQDGHISRVLEQLHDGLKSVTEERARLEEAGETSAALTLRETEFSLQSQYSELSSEFQIAHSEVSPAATTGPLLSDFQRPHGTSSTSLLKKGLRSTSSSKSVRFSDSPALSEGEDEYASRDALFPYRDDPSQTSDTPDHSDMDNQQIHAYHKTVLAEQDNQLDRLGESISRQRELSIQIGEELDEHVLMLDEVDGHVDRHATRLDKARKNLGTIARKAKDNMQMTIIIILIIILVLLIIVLK